jgi:hypothetical protein
VTCHELDVWDGISHRELWPPVVARLATAWGRDAEQLKQRLADHRAGLPRGRINYPRPGYIILHGGDSPPGDWHFQIIDRVHLRDGVVKRERTEHHTTDRRDLAAIEQALGVSLGVNRPIW